METTDIKFQLPVFEGPLDLLLHLIKTSELEISEISISQITSQYLEFMRALETMDLELAGDYLVMAATLINIKLRALLPSGEEELEDEAEGLDDFMSAKLLMQRLIEYRRFKEAAAALGRHGERQAQIFMREGAPPKLAEARQDPQVEGDLDLLLQAFARVIRFVDRRDWHDVQSESYTIEEKLTGLRRRLLLDERISLAELFGACTCKIEAIVTLMAALELCRMKELRVVQSECFDDALLVPRRGADEPGAEAYAEEQRAAEALEADIAAGRTGVIDDGIALEADEEGEDDGDPDEPSAEIVDMAGEGFRNDGPGLDP